MRRPQHIALLLGLSSLLICIALAGIFTYRLESTEQEHEGRVLSLQQAQGQPGSTKVSARLTELSLRRNDEVLFELCSRDELDPQRWQDQVSIAILRLSPLELLLKTPLDAAHLALANRSERGSCLQLGSGVIEHDGRYSVDIVFPDHAPSNQVIDVPLRARVLARHSLSLGDRSLIPALAASILLIIAGLWRAPSSQQALARRQPWPIVIAGLCCLGLAAQLPLWGSTLGLVKGTLLASIQVGFALLVYRPDLLALHRPQRPLAALTMAVLAGLVLSVNARIWLKIIPSTGTAPVETFISWPSGLLAFAAMGLFLPLAEEIFFRGFVYGALLQVGRRLAFVVSLVAFLLLHVQQTWGNWGSLLSILGTGLVLTTLRAVTGSTLVPALTHVTYNLMLALASL